jgi:hypothetical protein
MATGGYTLLDSGDLDDMLEHIQHHGYNRENGTNFIAIMNGREMKEARKFKAGVANNHGAIANYDFIPSPTQPTMIVPNEAGLLGERPPATWNGLPVSGSYGDILLIEEAYIPPGYVLMFGTGGVANLQNLVGIREHANPAYRGLRLLPGNQQRYPLVDSYYSRGFGTGVRQRGAGVIMQLVAGTTYTVPNQYKRGTGLVA